MIQLKSLERNPIGEAVAVYAVSFQNGVGRDGTIVNLDLKMRTTGGSTVLTCDVGECLASDPTMAMDKLAFWFEGFAKELREKKLKTTIPVFGS